MGILSAMVMLGRAAVGGAGAPAGLSAFGATAGGGAVSGGGGFMQRLIGGSKGKKMVESTIKGPKEILKNSYAQLKESTGISFTMSSVLRQSQIFTGFMGAIFQVVGAMMDVLLAPLAPFLFKALGWAARTGIPLIQRNAPAILKVIAGILIGVAFMVSLPATLLALGVIILIKHRKVIVEWLTKVNDVIEKVIMDAVGWLTNIFNNPIDWIKKAWGWLGNSTNWWSGPFHKFSEFFGDLWKTLTGWGTTITGWWNIIKLKAEDLWKFITDLPQKIKDKAIEVWAMISAWWENTIKPIFSPILSWFSNTLQTGWTNLVNFISAIGKGIALVAKTIIQFVVEKFVAVIDWLKGFPTTLANGIKDLWNGITEFFGSVLDPVINFFKNIFTKIWENVKKVLEFFNRGDFLKIGKGKLGTQIGTIEGIIGDLKKQTEQQKVQVILTQTIGGANGITTTNQDSYIASRNSLDNELTAIELAFESGTTEIAPVAR